MKLNHFLFRYGDIIATMWFKYNLEKDKNYKIMIFCHGLPSHPYQHNPAKIENLIKNGFVLMFPNYIGTWASDGIMSWENCVNTVLQTINFLNKCKGRELRNNLHIMWNVKDIILIGNSFGGSVALVSGAKSKDVKKIISIAAPTNYRDHSKIEDEEESIEKLYNSVVYGWKNLWRIPNKEEWERLVSGKADINPLDYINILKDKDVFLIHGIRDKIVSSVRSEKLYEKLKTGKGNHRLLLLENEGHLGYDSLWRKDLESKILDWL